MVKGSAISGRRNGIKVGILRFATHVLHYICSLWMLEIGFDTLPRMTALLAQQQPLTVSEFLPWAEKQTSGRYELYSGQIYAMSQERTRHAETKHAIASALKTAIRHAGLGCYMLPDGMTVVIDNDTAYEPDALVYCGEKLPGDAIEVPNPIIIVEVASPGTEHIDTGVKLEGYFSLPSVVHYLILDPVRRVITHHARNEGPIPIKTSVIRAGEVRLDPPGISFQNDEAFG